MATLNKVVVFRKPDDSIIKVYFIDSAIHDGMDEDEFIDYEVGRIISNNPIYATYTRFDITKSELNSISSGVEKRSILCDSKGLLYIDPDYKSKAELNVISLAKEDSLRQKLKTGQTLTDEDVDILLGKQ